MRISGFGANTAVFLLFFLLSLFEAVTARNWVLAALFLALGVISLRADVLKR